MNGGWTGSPAEHEVMGKPSAAVTDANFPHDYLIERNQYVLSYDRDKSIPNWVAWHLDSSWIGSTSRQNDYRNDTSLPAGWYQVLATDYSGSGFDRGHDCPSGDRTSSVTDNSATFLMTNFIPQAPDNNQGPWEVLESYCRTLASQGNEMYIFMGNAGVGGTGSNGGVTNSVAAGRVVVPAYTWKVVMVLPNGSNDLSRVDNNTRVFAVIMPNTQGIRTDAWQKYLATVDQVEALTGYDVFSNVSPAVQSVIESRLDPASNTSPQILAGGTYTNLNITAPNTSLTGNITVNGTLTLGGSTIITGANKISFGPNATVSRLSGYINGNAERQFAGAPASFTYPVGTNNGYSPVTANVTALGVSPSSLMVKAVEGVQPNVTSASTALKRYWTLTEAGDITTNLTFNYLDADVPAGILETSLSLNRYSGSFTEIPTMIDANANTASAIGITQFSDWTLLPTAAPTAVFRTISGRLQTPDGKVVRNSLVSFSDQHGNSKTVLCSPFGFFRFDGVTSGDSVVLSVVSKSHQFSPTMIVVNDNLAGVVLTAQ